PDSGPGVFWPVLAAALLIAAWILTAASSRLNRSDKVLSFYGSLLAAALLAVLGGAALFAGPWTSGMDPTRHVHPATVWLLVGWTILHVAIGAVMQLYCIARRMAGRMTARHDI